MLTHRHALNCATSAVSTCVLPPPMTVKRQADLLSTLECNPSASRSRRGHRSGRRQHCRREQVGVWRNLVVMYPKRAIAAALRYGVFNAVALLVEERRHG